MCRHQRIIRCGMLAVLPSPLVACNALLGVENVSAVDCHARPDFPQISSSTSATILSHFMDGTVTGPELDFSFDADGTGLLDDLIIRLYDKSPPHGVLNAPGDYDLFPSDATLQSCGICITIHVDFRTPLEAGVDVYRAIGQGHLKLMKADTTGMAGSLNNLKLRMVDDNDVDVNNGCSITIEDVEFDAAYSTPAQ
jgi:hypothetical protein